MLETRQDEHIFISAKGQSPEAGIEICSLSIAPNIYIIMSLNNTADKLGILVTSSKSAKNQELLLVKLKYVKGSLTACVAVCSLWHEACSL